MGLNLILIAVGLSICFGGIYFRRLFSGLLGLICGALGALTFVLVTAGIWAITDDSTFISMIICGIVVAVVSAIYYKVCSVINSFLSTFALIGLLLAITGAMDSGTGVIIVAAVVAIIVAAISFKFYDYSYLITTALMGAFIASIGGFGLVMDYSIEDTLFEILLGDYDSLLPIIIATVLLGVIGFLVQLKRLKTINSASKNTTENKDSNKEQINHFAVTNNEQPNKAVQTYTLALQDDSSQIFKSINDTNVPAAEVKLPETRGKLKDEVIKEWRLFIVPIIAVFFFEILVSLMNNVPSVQDFLYSQYWLYIIIFGWGRMLAWAITDGICVYFFLRKDRRFTLFYALFCTAGTLLSFLMSPRVAIYYGVMYIVVGLLQHLVIWIVLDLLSRNIRNETIKPIILIATKIVIGSFVIPLIASIQKNIYFRVQFSIVISVVVTIATVYILLYLYKTDRKKEVVLSDNQVAVSTVTPYVPTHSISSGVDDAVTSKSEDVRLYCPQCGHKLKDSDDYCANCGKKAR